MENKKTKLTISGNPKKTFKNLGTSKTQGKKTVIIEKKLERHQVNLVLQELLTQDPLHLILNMELVLSLTFPKKPHHPLLILKDENWLNKEQLKY